MGTLSTAEINFGNLGILIRRGLGNVRNKYLNNRADTWDRMYAEGYRDMMDAASQRPRYYAILGLLADFCPKRPSILDVGCGNGTAYRIWRGLEPRYHGLDISRVAIDQANETYGPSPERRFEVGDFVSMPFDQTYDTVVFNEVLYYFPLNRSLDIVRKALSLLNENGLLVISMSRNPKARLAWRRLDSLVPRPLQSIGIESHSGARWTVRAYRTERPALIHTP